MERHENLSTRRSSAALEAAIALYLANFDLMVEARTAVIIQRTQENLHALHDAVTAHAPRASAELLELQTASDQVRESLAGDGTDLRRLQNRHTRAVSALRALIGGTGKPCERRGAQAR